MATDTAPTWARQQRRGNDASVLVCLQEEGDKPPLFFAPAGHGDLRRFRAHVAGLGRDQPVYGLRPPAARLGLTLPAKPVDWLVSMYVESLKHVQPTGPYRLVGYSLGGIFAVEIARELDRRGDEVDLLVALDPPVKCAMWIAILYLSLYKLCNLTSLTNRIRWSIIRRWDSRLLRWASDEGLCTHTAVLKGHDLGPCPVRVTCVRPRRSWIQFLDLTCIGRSWSQVVQNGQDIHWIVCTHYDILEREQVESIVAVLRDSLDRKAP